MDIKIFDIVDWLDSVVDVMKSKRLDRLNYISTPSCGVVDISYGIGGICHNPDICDW